MSKRVPSVIIRDILICIDHLQQYTEGLSLDEFTRNFMVAEACLYNIQIIGEAAGRLPDDVRKSAPEIPWVLMKGIRNRLIHEYFGTDLTVVWQVIKNELPSFRVQLEKIYHDLSQDGR